ncbi:MAG: zinc-ribbon domain-containing protein [Dehalococcoidia bacterium]
MPRRWDPNRTLAKMRPELIAEWHPTKNADLTPHDVAVSSGKRVWWKCSEGPDHEWIDSLNNRSTGKKCGFCHGSRVSITNCLSTVNPELAAEWHPDKNGELTPSDVTLKSGLKVWWKCHEGPDHEWEAKIANRANGRNCGFCAGKRVSVTNRLDLLAPEVAEQWHPNRNGDLSPSDFTLHSGKVVWWKCPEGPDHEFRKPILERVGAFVSSETKGCGFCRGLRVARSNSLATIYPDLADQWHPTKNGTLTPDKVTVGSGKKVWWKCPEGPDHVWQSPVKFRAAGGVRSVHDLGGGCPRCNLRRVGWTIDNLRRYIRMLTEGDPCPLYTMAPDQLYCIYMQAEGLLEMGGKGKSFLDALQTGRFPKEEIEKFVNEEPSLVDEFISGDIESVDELDEENINELESADHLDDSELSFVDENSIGEDSNSLPEVAESGSLLGALEHTVMATIDQEAVEFLMTASTLQLWSKVYPKTANVDEEIAQIKKFQGNSYGEEVKSAFLEEYESAKSLEIPNGYNFRNKQTGEIAEPLLMQRHVATKVRDKRRVGNWSGTGAGKTLSAILASRVVDSSLTVILCPNAVVEMWSKEILEIYPDSQVRTKTWDPDWNGDDSKKRYLVLNYDMFQDWANTPVRLQNFLKNNIPEFIIVDEIHFAKTTDPNGDSISTRRKYVEALVAGTQDVNPNLHTLGMSATPVINTLAEGTSLLQIVTGERYIDLDTAPTAMNAQKIHQQFVRHGLRWMPDYSEFLLNEDRPAIDIAEYVDEIRELGKSDIVGLEQVLTRAKLPEILKNIKPKTLIYTMYIKGIDRILYDAITAAGWKVGFYTGKDKSGLEPFKNGNIDVLIGTSAIGTGVDGLQHMCNRLIVNVLPWTAAEYEQLKGRIYRTGQTQSTVDVIMPATYAELPNGHRWSWDDSKWARVKFKKSLADAAVDGVVPEGKLRSPAEGLWRCYEMVKAARRFWCSRNTQASYRDPLLGLRRSGRSQAYGYVRRFL